jgi:hypothetical protein
VPRPGHTLAVAVYRPLAEQLAGLAAPRAGQRVLELSAGDGELTTRLREAVGAQGMLEVVQGDRHFTQPADHFDLAISLLAIDAQDELHAVLPQLAVVASRVLVTAAGGGATYDNALRTAWRAVVGDELTALPPPDPVTSPNGWRQRRLSDVARFDGIGQLFTALTDERGIDVPGDRRDALRERLAREVAAFTAADGTMRIPVHVTLVEHGAADNVSEERR